MDIRVLGPMEATSAGRPLAIGGGKPRALLAMLALQAGATVSTETLVEGLWGEEPPATAVKMVQLYVSQLRKALAAGEGGEIVTRGRGYELRLEPDDVDARRFERLVAAGAPREALGLWRGRPLADVAAEPFAAAEIRRLEELRLAALELAVDQDLRAGRHREVVGELEALVAEEPLRERLHAQRMLALYRSGRQAEALDAYRDARRVLVEEVGLEPGPELRSLHEAILRQDPGLSPLAEGAGELPPELDAGTALVEREHDLDVLREQWRSAHGGAGRVALVAGEHGIGKTRLAAELAAEIHRDRGAVLYASGAGAPGTALAALAAASVARRPTLLVLDDADRVTHEVLATLGELIDAIAALPVLLLMTAADPTALVALRADATCELGPLGPDGVRAVAERHTSAVAGADVPVDRLVTATRGIPREVHRAAAEWARSEAVLRLGAGAERAATGRAGLRAAEVDLAGRVMEVQAAQERLTAGDAGIVSCPFKGLAAFGADDAEVFFGRERLVAELVARLAGAPLTGIVGRSGSGKSSVLRAGLLPALAAGVLPGSDRRRIVLLRPGAHPVEALTQATGSGSDRLIIAVDQFEELFTACEDEAERAAFADALVGCTRGPAPRAIVLVAIRADFYGRCDAYPELAGLLGANHVLVAPMRREELRRVIELPARQAGLVVEPELADALLADVAGEPGALPLLSTALLELWQRRDGRRLTLRSYEDAGGVQGAVARLAERAYARLEPERRPVARRLLVRLAGEGEGDAVVRRRVPLAELEAEGVAEVLDVLADERLVTVGEGEAEVAHEALLREWPRLAAWLEEDAGNRRLHARLRAAAKDWETGGRDPGELYRGARLASALDWEAGHAGELTATEHAFLRASRRAGERSQRRLRIGLTGVAVLLVLAVVAGLVALDQRGSARREAVAADAQRLGARALVEDDLDRSLLLARQGLALDESVRTRGNLLAALVRSPAVIGVMRGDAGRMWRVALSPDGKTVAAGDPEGHVFLFDPSTRRRAPAFKPAPGDSWIVSLAFSPDGRHLAVAHDSPRGNVVAVFDVRTRRAIARMTPPRDRWVSGLRYSADGAALDTLAVTPDPAAGPALLTRFDARTGRRRMGPKPVNRERWSPLLATSDGTRLITGGPGEITVRDRSSLRTLERFTVAGHEHGEPGAYALSPDDRTLAIGNADGQMRFLDLRTGAVRRASGRHEEPVTGAAFTSDGRNLVSTAHDGKVLVWDAGQGTIAETLTGHASGIAALALSRTDDTAFTAGLDGTVMIWDLVGTRRVGQPFQAGEGDEQRPHATMSSDGRLLATGQDDGAVSLVDLRTLARRPMPVVDTGKVLGIGFVPGSRLLVVGGPEGFLALVDTRSGRVVRRLRGHTGDVFTPGVSPALLATADGSETVRLWSVPDGRPQGAPLRFPRGVEDVRLSPDGRLLAVVTVAGDIEHSTIEVLDPRTRRRVARLRVPDHVGTSGFSPDGRLFATGSRTGATQVWSTADWKPVGRPFVGDSGGILGVAISPDGRTLATGGDTGSVQVWDIPTRQAVGARLPGVPSRSAFPAFTRDGAFLIASYDTGDAYRWDVRTRSLVRHACRLAGRRLTRAEWAEFLPGRSYDPAC